MYAFWLILFLRTGPALTADPNVVLLLSIINKLVPPHLIHLLSFTLLPVHLPGPALLLLMLLQATKRAAVHLIPLFVILLTTAHLPAPPNASAIHEYTSLLPCATLLFI